MCGLVQLVAFVTVRQVQEHALLAWSQSSTPPLESEKTFPTCLEDVGISKQACSVKLWNSQPLFWLAAAAAEVSASDLW